MGENPIFRLNPYPFRGPYDNPLGSTTEASSITIERNRVVSISMVALAYGSGLAVARK